MAQHYITFAGETTGAAPANFTSRWTATGETWAVREKAGALGGKTLEHTRTTTARRGFSWDTPGSDTDTEILMRFRTTTNASNQFGLIVRGSGAAGTEGGYLFAYRTTAGVGRIRIAKLIAGVETTISEIVLPTEVNGELGDDLQTNEWYWARFRVNGTDLKAKFWLSDHMAEPATWAVETTDGDILGAGWMGLSNIAATGTRDYDDIAVGTNGDTAVFPPSAEERVTAAPMLVLSAADSDIRTTQSALLVLYQESTTVPTRVTQSALLAVAEFDTEIRNTQSALLVLADQVPCLTRWAECWAFTRTDGLVLGYTSHDRPVMFRGVEHVPCNSLSATAVEMSSIVGATGSIDLRGLLSQSGVNERDLYNGLYDGALIEAWMVPWANAGGEIPFRLMAGTVGANGFATATYRQELLTEASRLQQRALLEVVTPSCRYLFGNENDERCPVDLGALQVAGSVTNTAIPNASTDSLRRIFTDSSRAEVDRYFSLGRVTWTSGANVGAVSEVKDFSSGQFILWESLLNPIAVGDAYTATPGCDKSTTAHLSFNADLVGFGGYPHLPGQDAIVATPNAKG